MNFLDVFLISIALSMDACIVTISNCATYKNCLDKKRTFAMPVAFGVFQGLMPLIGFFIGSLFFKYIEGFIGYISSAIFFVLALKIVIDIVKNKNDMCDCNKNSKFTFTILLIQAVATSIDALAIGFSFGALTFNVYLAVLTIAIVTLILVSLAILLGNQLQKLLDKYAEWIGAIILFFLSIKSLIEAIIS